MGRGAALTVWMPAARKLERVAMAKAKVRHGIVPAARLS